MSQKRINLPVLLEGDIFEKSVKEAVIAEAKNIARDAVDKTMKEEIRRISEYYVKSTDGRYDVREMIKQAVGQEVSETVKMVFTNDVIEMEIRRTAESRIQYQVDIVAQNVRAEINRKIDSIIKDEFTGMLARRLEEERKNEQKTV